MTGLRARIKRSFRAELVRSRLVIRWGGILGTLAHPAYYLVWTVFLPQPYDHLGLRLSASALCIPLVLLPYWPRRHEGLPLAYWHACLIYVLPFACTFLAIKNNFSTMWMMTEVMIVFIMALCIDVPLLLMAYLLIGMGAATLAALLTGAAPALTAADKADLILLPFIMLCGMAFSRAIQEGRAIVEKGRALQAVAASIAHEMRNPLGQIQFSLDRIGEALPCAGAAGHAQLLSDQKIGELYRHLAQGRLAIARGLQVISMTLDEVSTQAIAPASFVFLSAADATRKAIDEYGFESEADRQKVRMQVVKDFTFRGNETVFLFVLFNLIKNAAYYFVRYPASTLTIRIDRHCVSVTDTGPGIARQDMASLFEPFQTSGKNGGTGLGLAYCRRAMHAFNGEISCDSIAGQFTTFTLRFPPVPAAELYVHKQAFFMQAREVLEGKRILLVDDSMPWCLTVRAMLRGITAAIDDVPDGQAALARLAQRQYDLIIMDLHMPQLDGYATAAHIRAGATLQDRRVPIVALSSELAHVAGAKVRKAGMNAFVNKSCSRTELIACLRETLEQAQGAALPARARLLAGKTVLLTDDDRYNRQILRTILQQHEVNIVEAAHGQQALDLLAAGTRCDALIIDIRMPGLDGVQTTAILRAMSVACRAMPVIALTGYASQANIDAARRAGIDAFITKPVDTAVLLETLARQLAAAAQPAPASVPASVPASTWGESAQGADDAATPDDLLDLSRIAELQGLDLLDDFLRDYLAQIDPVLAHLGESVASHDFEGLHDALHKLLGISGTLGGAALHQYVRRQYIAIEQGLWPSESGWSEHIHALAVRTREVLRLLHATVRSNAGIA